MDGIKKLAEKLQVHEPKEEIEKVGRTINVDINVYNLLLAYCKRKGLFIGDVVNDLMNILLEELALNGELTLTDQNRADKITEAKNEADERKKRFKRVS